MVIGIIGGGASGMAAALAAAEKEEVQVILLERQARVGRKGGKRYQGMGQEPICDEQDYQLL